MRPGIILQARMASQRLPGKALELVDGRPMVEQCVRRLLASAVAPVVLATTTRPDDDVLAEAGAHADIPVFRGSDEDVLDRFIRCADDFAFDVVIRATADNPAVDIDAAGRVIEAMRGTGAEYVREDDLPCGAAVEGITTSALRRAAVLARDAFDREHVTTFVRRHETLFDIAAVRVPLRLARPDVRLTVDTPDDLDQVRALYSLAGRGMPSVVDFIQAWDRRERRSAA